MTQKSYGLMSPEYMYIMQDGNETLYGCDQDWYKIEWRRRAGCGPVAATNILFYLQKKYGVEAIPYSNGSVDEALSAMNDIFTYVRPKRRGLHTVRKFVKGMCKFGHRYGLSIRYKYIIVPPQAEKRPCFDEVSGFVEEGLMKDVPVVFLNLHAGEVEDQLQSWHWVTVVGMKKTGLPEDGSADGEASGETDLLQYYDQSKSLEVDLGRWLKTTMSGGGFAYFCKPSPRVRKMKRNNTVGGAV